MTHALQNEAIALDKLDLHPMNVRAGSPETYEPDNIAHLKASIAALGLIEPLVVQQKTKTRFGVLAGGRRLAALKALAEDKDGKSFAVTAKSKIDCRIVPKDCDSATAISLAENITQAEMSPIDQYEAFANMMQVDGQSPETIALTFGTTVAAVKERLRYGLVHPEIRKAARQKLLTLDAVKAFAGHPSQDAQLEIYEALIKTDDRPGAWQIRKAIAERGIRSSDELGQFVLDEYKAAGGSILSDLLDEDGLMEDTALVEELVEAKLRKLAEEVREAEGFAWADAMITHDWQAFQPYGRIYPGPIDVDAETQAHIDKITEEICELEEQAEDEAISQEAYDALWEKIDALTDEADQYQSGYDPEDLKTAGVIASWNGGVTISKGLVRPEDRKDTRKTSTATKPEDAGAITYSGALEADLKTERAIALGAALASTPELASDLALFKLVSDGCIGGMPVTCAFGIKADRQFRNHSRKDAQDQTATVQLDALREGLPLDWAGDDLSPAEQFAGFRVLGAADKDRLVGFALSQTLEPALAANPKRESLMAAIEAEAMPDLRAHWTPNAGFFDRLKKPQLIGILNDLGLSQEAATLSGGKKGEIVSFLDTLFAEPFATLTDAQREAVEAWCPPGMQTAPVVLAEVKTRGKAKATKADEKAAA